MIAPFAQYQPKLADGVYIDDQATVIGRVSIDEDSSVWPHATIRGDVHSITIGKRCSIQDGAVLHVTHSGPFTPGGLPLIVGDDVTIGHQATLHACTIGDRCLIGIGAIVLDNAVLQPEVMLAAGSLVSPGKTLESGHLYVGSPAKKMRALSEKEREFLQYSANNYVKLKNVFLNKIENPYE